MDADSPSALPDGFNCPSCGYDLSGARTGPCSECGLEITSEIVEADARNRRFRQQRPWLWFLLGLWPLAVAPPIFILLFFDPFLETWELVLIGFIYGAIAVLPLLFATVVLSLLQQPWSRWVTFCVMLSINSISLLPAAGVLLATAILFFANERWYDISLLPEAFGVGGGLVGVGLARWLWPVLRDVAIERAGLYVPEGKRKQLRVAYFVSATPSMFMLAFPAASLVAKLIVGDD